MLTAADLRERMTYEPDTGLFRWRVSPSASLSHRIKPGDIAGTRTNQGYWQISVRNRRYRACRLAWLYMTGEWPALQVDHEDGDKLNNRWGNLRLATVSQNQMNTPMRQHNKVGLKGVVQNKSGTFGAYIKRDGKSRNLGTFATPHLAHAAYVKAASNLFGEFARLQ